MNGDIVLLRRQGRVVTLSLNRPDKRNARNPEMLQALATTLTSLREDSEVRCVVLRCAGEDTFSAHWLLKSIGRPIRRILEIQPMILKSWLALLPIASGLLLVVEAYEWLRVRRPEVPTQCRGTGD